VEPLKISTGTICIPVERDGEATGVLKLTPGDVNFANRYMQLLTAFDTKQKELLERMGQCEASHDKAGEVSIAAEFFAFVNGQIDYVFGEGTSAMLFGEVCTTEMYQQFFTAVTPIFQQARSGNVERYTRQSNGGVME